MRSNAANGAPRRGCSPPTLLAVALSLCACGLAPAGAAPDAAAATLELGTGQDRFEPIEDGATLALTRGCQGSQHVLVALRAHGVHGERALVDVELRRARDELRVAQTLLRLTLTPREDALEVAGLTLVVPAPDEALGEALRLLARVRDTDGRSAEARRDVAIAWGPDGCPGHG